MMGLCWRRMWAAACKSWVSVWCLLYAWVMPEGGCLVHGDLKTGGGVQSREVQSWARQHGLSLAEACLLGPTRR